MIWLMYAGHLFKGEIGSPERIHAVLFEISLFRSTYRSEAILKLET